MKQVYDPLDGGLQELIKDMKKLSDELVIANQTIIKSFQPLILRTVNLHATMVSDIENHSAVVNFNKFRYVPNKYKPTLNMTNDNEQATYSEYGYGTRGELGPQYLFALNKVFGDMGYGRGYNVESRYKRIDPLGLIYWWHTSKLNGISYRSYGMPSIPVFYRTYLQLERELPIIYQDRLIAIINKL